MGRGTRWRALAGLGVRTALRNVFSGGQSTLSVAGVALAIGLMLSVTSLGLGIAAAGVAAGGPTEYVVTPEDGASSVVADVSGQQLGRVHDTTERIEGIEGVQWATPMLVTASGVNRSGDREYVLVIGVVAGPETEVAGLSTADLALGDPLYEGDERTGEAIVSASAANTLDYAPGDRLTLLSGSQSANRTFRVIGVEEPNAPGLGQFPVALVHLSELQAITGASEADAADRIVVSATDADVRDRLAGIYPNSEVQTRSELVRERALDSQLTLAVGVGSFLVAVVVGVLFVATTMGFELAAESRDRAVLRAVGVSRGSRLLLVAIRTVVVCLLGGLGGAVLWLAAGLGVNAVSTTVAGGRAVAVLHPAFPVVGLAAALLIGLLTLPYLLLASRSAAEALPR